MISSLVTGIKALVRVLKGQYTNWPSAIGSAGRNLVPHRCDASRLNLTKCSGNNFPQMGYIW